MSASSQARAIAEREQLMASDPGVSAFVSASAGSGKTKLLTDRLLRLMLAGADPGRIQCLTFTKAGASEMAVRLQRRLGDWVTATDAELDGELRRLALPADAALRDSARQLFARVLDLPGGMRIGTIHAFCQSLLRRFPLEAALSPHFELLDETDAEAMRRAAREAAIAAARGADGTRAEAVETIATELTLDQFAGLLGKLQSRPERLTLRDPEALEAAQRRVLGLGAQTVDDTLRSAIAAMDLPGFRAALQTVAGGINGHLKDKVPAVLAWLATAPPARLEDWHGWARYFLRADGNPCDESRLLSKPLDKANPGLRQLLLDEQARVCAVLEQLRTLHLAKLSAALMRLALPAIDGYDARKRQADWLDYGDLITRANALLHEPGAAWVLYKLDGGLDHLLLDEVQDTAPDQWRIADALTTEFFAGAGAREDRQGRDGAAPELPRTVFAVGDHKQSIFSFQGAAPEGFDHWAGKMRARTLAAGGRWAEPTLDVSFRSTAPVLGLVDAVFADPQRSMGVPGAAVLRHIADRADHAGRVELWPLVPRPVPAVAAPWESAAAVRPPPGGAETLAAALAEWIAGQTDGSVMLESRGRLLHAGDVLVLVRNRGSFDRALLRGLKARGVAVAGLDRMMLSEQPAVADLLALCAVLLLPGDELSLAAVLTSPLGGLSDDSLMALALGRRRGLWETLRERAGERAEWRAAWTMLASLAARVDYVGPHALLSEALGPLGGRARLFARLGPQAAEPVDELLSIALSYAARHPPSLQGFLHWLAGSGSEIKREAEGASRELRIMTVHGAKGLQAPLVILPATVSLADRRPTLVWAPDPVGGASVPIWGPRRETHDEIMRGHLAKAVDLEREEHYRLLYVALTRAEDRLLVCGWEPRTAGADSWYDVVRDGFGRLAGATSAPFAAIGRPWEGIYQAAATPQVARPEPTGEAAAAARDDPPAWLGAGDGWHAAPPTAEPAVAASLAPSRPADAALGEVPQAASPLALRDASGRRFRRGQLLHTLMQHLPAVPAAERGAAALAWLRRPGIGITSAEAATLAGEVARLLDDPALAPLFGPGSRAEVPLTGIVATAGGEAVIGGLVDRLVELPDRVLIADYKTNREPPASIDDTPTLYLGQMAAYRALLGRIFPGKPIACVLIWTRTGRADWLPDALLDAAMAARLHAAA